VGIGADADGMLPEAIASACEKLRPKALYCIPTIQNPTTLTMPLRRRKALADTARQHGLPIVEDDAYGLLPSNPVRAIASLAPEITFHVATVSKVLSPALRLAYVVAPEPGSAERLSRALRANVLMASPLLTGLMTGWIQDGTAASVLSAIRGECAARQQVAREILPPESYAAHPEGLHLWLSVPSRWDRRELVAHLQGQGGLAVVPSDAFAVGGAERAPNAVRVSLGAAPTRRSLRDALQLLAASLAGERLATFSEVV
jgi:DNA-binding transcriptional MocR family regulator